jgi:hypothetical protein
VEYAKEMDIADDNNEYAIDDNGDNEPLAEGDDNDDNKQASSARCAGSIILSARPPESMILSELVDIVDAKTISPSLNSQNYIEFRDNIKVMATF